MIPIFYKIVLGFSIYNFAVSTEVENRLTVSKSEESTEGGGHANRLKPFLCLYLSARHEKLFRLFRV